MNDYISTRIDVSPCTEDTTDLLAAYLSDIDYESFEPDDSGLTAYVPSGKFSKEAVDSVLSDFPIPASLTASHTLVEGRDWNEEWEKNYFKPIVIDDLCVIHSTFHKDVPEAKYDIVIDPKMAFGTGHHATTSMIVGHLLNINLDGKRVIDMGTGTGILAILCMMRGASEAYGIEIDPAACVNARENVALNNCKVAIIEGDSSALASLPEADLFIANINRNVILADLSRYAAALRSGGEMLLSGFYKADIPLIERSASLYGLTITDVCHKDGEWTSLRLKKQ